MRQTCVALHVVVVALVTLQPACSFLFVKAPPEVPAEAPLPLGGVDCSRRFTGPIMDSVAVSSSLGLSMLALLAMASQPYCYEGDTTCSRDDGAAKALLGTSLVAAGVFTASAIYGYRTVYQCRVLQRRLTPQPWAPGAPYPGYYGAPPAYGAPPVYGAPPAYGPPPAYGASEAERAPAPDRRAPEADGETPEP